MAKLHKPKPFQRPAIDLTEVRRRWQTVLVSSLVPGDMVPGHGEVVKVTTSANVAVEFFSQEVAFWARDAEVWAFTERR